ncbi:hypothetical protein [Agrobacterium pusense]|uniref:hypothetical protein n=1 Tax=Agrobacterium pusense TaxID=648995 RepID=UPI000D1B7956|nr:hypothetical protein [Agrobacterium pusense]
MADTVKHTPGPWQIEGRYDVEFGSLYLSTIHPMPIFELQPLVGSRDVHLANARLIAAAPDLLEALIDCIGRFTEAFPASENYEPIQKARVAIAKAKGRS